MNSPFRGRSIVGVGCSTRDRIVVAASSNVPPQQRVAIGIPEPERFANIHLAASLGYHDWTPGGTVPNTLCAAAMTREVHQLSLAPIVWYGPAEYGDSVLSDVGLTHMREWGIDVLPVYQPGFVREAYCIIDSSTRNVSRISIYEQESQIISQSDWMPCDMLLLTVGDFARADAALLNYVQSCRQLALLMADWRPTLASPSLLDCIERIDNLAFIVGQQRDYIELGLCDAQTRRFHPSIATVECVGTNGSEPVVWKASDTKSGELLSLPPLPEYAGNVLGAGDGYAGAFLACRIAGGSSIDAHALAWSHAQNVMREPTSYVPRCADLNRIFPPQVARRSASTTEADFARRIRKSPGLVVTSCGQTGIDQLASQIAHRLGITCFALMPEGRRTECSELGIGGPDQLAGINTLQLATRSYRFSTWANVFASDGTLLLDHARSEGSEETRRAAAWFRRPLLELQEVAVESVAASVKGWVERYGLRVINCAGTRMSLLDDAARSNASEKLRRALLSAAAAIARRDSGIRMLPSWLRHSEGIDAWPGLVIAAPNNAVSRHLLRSFLIDESMLDIEEAESVPAGKLTWWVPSSTLKIVFARARDLPMALRWGWVDYAVFGQDIWLDDAEAIEPLFPLGVEACCLVEVVRDGRAPRSPRESIACGSAWPNLARSLLGRDEPQPTIKVVPITGCAEAWLRHGNIDSAIDTYQTGNAVRENGLHVARRFQTVHLWMHRKANSPARLHPLIPAFARWLDG